MADRVDLRVRERDGAPFSANGHGVETCPTAHSAAGFVYRVDDAFTFSGDTEASERVAAFADGSAVLVHDCAYPDESRSNHATPATLGRALAAVDVGRLYLTHLYPEAAAAAERVCRTVNEHVDAATRAAADLETVEIPDAG